MTFVHIATRKARGAARSLRATANRFRFLQAVDRLPAFPVPQESDRVIHLLAGHTRVPGTIATLASALRFFARHERPSVRVFDDGTLTAADAHQLMAHVPGVDVIERAAADRLVGKALADRELTHCRMLREQLVVARKLFDLVTWASRETVVLLDTDILFFERPQELLSATGWRYNQDIRSVYSWPGVSMPRVNSGLLVIPPGQRTPWEEYEAELRARWPIAAQQWYIEQTLFAMDCGRYDAEALPPDYDVSFRHAWSGRGDYTEWLASRGRREGHRAVSQHYCGGFVERDLFNVHFTEHVAPATKA